MKQPSVQELSERTVSYLNTLCTRIPTRMVGTEGNREATEFFRNTVESFGFETEKDQFDCILWNETGAELTAGGVSFEVHVSPFSLSCDLQRQLIAIATMQELETADIREKIVLLHGSIAAEQIMPKNFPFYNPDHHKKLIRLLEEKKPAALIAATGKNSDMAGAVYPFPLFEDGDLLIPSVYMKDVFAEKLLDHVDKEVQLCISSERTSSVGYNITGKRGDFSKQRIVIFSHIDAKIHTPGATDNATGVALLLLLAELLRDYDGSPGVELVALNGEDYYSNPGEKLFLRKNEGTFDNILLGINSDGLGLSGSPSAYSLYNCPNNIAAVIHDVFQSDKTFTEGPQWYQGDHSIFLMHEVPALAVTTTELNRLMSEIVHTEKDAPGIVDPELVVNTALSIRKVIVHLKEFTNKNLI